MSTRPLTPAGATQAALGAWVVAEARLLMACMALGEDGLDPSAVDLRDLDPATYAEVMVQAQHAVMRRAAELGITTNPENT